MRRSPALGRLALAMALLFLLSCFEQPVRESLTLRFLPGNAVVVGVTVALADERAFEESRAARERIEALGRDLQAGRDDWSRRIDTVEPALERSSNEREKGRLRRVVRQIVLENPEDLRRFFSDTLLRPQFTAREEESELQILVQPGSRASRAQREELQRRLEAWSEALARYLADTSELYAYLDQHPRRAAACLGAIFAGELGEEEAKKLEPLEPAEERMTEALGASLERTLDLFTPSSESAVSLQELSELAWNPLPASLVLKVPGPILEQEGFVDRGDGILEVRTPGLWESLQALGERWVQPDLLALKVRALKTGKPVPLADLARRPRRAAAPAGAAALRAQLEQAIPRPAACKVRWSTRNLQAPETEEALEEIWRAPSPP